jgi:NADPH2:quinone reductase
VIAMLIVEAAEFGGPHVLTPRHVPDPVAGRGQVVVRTAAADVLFVDTAIRAGRAVDFFPIRPPYVPGNGVAGRVISLGKGTDPAWAGRAVVAHTGGSGGSGGYAGQVAVAAADLIPVPDELGLPEAAALLHDGSTAMGLLEETGVKPGEHVLITAAAGGMGVLLVQLARAAGGRVIAAARGRRKLRVVRNVGAEEVVDYSAPDWACQVRELTAGRGPDVVFDGAGGNLGAAAFDVIAPGGRFSAHGMSDGGFAPVDPAGVRRRGITVNGIGGYTPALFRQRAAAALAEAAAGRLSPVIGQEYPLAGAADAHAALESRIAVAKTLLRPLPVTPLIRQNDLVSSLPATPEPSRTTHDPSPPLAVTRQPRRAQRIRNA